MVHQQLHGYRGGHQLLESSLRLNTTDQDVIDHLSDIAGPVRPGERFPSYLTAYPLPSREYYAIGVTEQDVEAPRAGCVRTTTILAPMSYWEKEAVPASLVGVLRNSTEVKPIVPGEESLAPPLPPLLEPALVEIVSALFFGRPGAIVVFGADNPEFIVLRLLTAFWPSRRRSFSVCTFALAPRTITGTPFDLVFAPQSVRSRFSEWRGYSIDVRATDTEAQDRTASLLSRRVFLSRVPHLVDADTMRSLVGDDDHMDDNKLRLCLLWEDLLDRALAAPTAVLGLVDIAKTCGNERGWEVVESVAHDSATKVARSDEIASAWAFLGKLGRKLEKAPDTGLADRAISVAADLLIKRSWRQGLSFFQQEMTMKDIYKTRPGVLLKAAARGLSRVHPDTLSLAISEMAALQLTQTVLFDDELMARLFSGSDVEVINTIFRKITEVLKYFGDRKYRGRLFSLLFFVRGDMDRELVRRVIANANTRELVEAVNMVWREGRRRHSGLGDVLCAAAIARGSRLEVRAEFAGLVVDPETDLCIERLLRPVAADVKWLLDYPMNDRRRVTFLSRLIDRSGLKDLRQAFKDEDIAARALRILSIDVGGYASAVSRLFRVSGINGEKYLSLGMEAHGFLESSERREIAQGLVSRAFACTGLAEEFRPDALLVRLIDDVELEDVISDALEVGRGGGQVSRALVALQKVSLSIGGIGGLRLLQIVRLVAARVVYDLTGVGTKAIVRLLEDAGQRGERRYIEICSTILPFAMDAVRNPASEIVKVAFPPVYSELRKGRENSWLVDFFEFLDWDRCKVARKDLVRAFMRAEWPPLDLAIIGLRSGDLKSILKRVKREKNGARYLKKIEESVSGLDDFHAAVVRDAVGLLSR